MPYITQARREAFQDFESKVSSLRIDSAGELNYLLTKLMLTYLSQHGMNYRICNEIIGAANCAVLEFYRRKVAPSEDKKCAENGDVFQVTGATE